MSGWPTAAPPSGFRRASAASGLLVPEDSTPRARQVWTKDEVRLHDRFVALMQARGLKVAMRCGLPDCDGEIRRIQDAGGFIFRCACTDRVFQRKH